MNDQASRLEQLLTWFAVTVLFLGALGCCIPSGSGDDGDVVEPYEGEKRRSRSNETFSVTQDGMDVLLYGDHAYRDVHKLHRIFDRDDDRMLCTGDDWNTVMEYDVKNHGKTNHVEILHCEGPGYAVPMQLSKDTTDMYAYLFDGVLLAWFFESDEQTIQDAKNRYQRLVNFRLRSRDCRMFDENTDVYQCFNVFSHVRREGKKVILIQASIVTMVDAVLKRIYSHDKHSRFPTKAEIRTLKGCGLLEVDCKI